MFPAWSPDGARIALAGGVDGTWMDHPSQGDLYVMDVETGPTPTGERCGGAGECCDGYTCQGNACVGTLF